MIEAGAGRGVECHGYVGRSAGTRSLPRPTETLRPLHGDDGKFFFSVELETKGQLHAVPQGLQEAVFVRGTRARA